LQDLPARLLAALLERPGELITRAELRQRMWGAETFVDYDAGLNTAIAKLRDALEDHAEKPVFIETVPRRGYRWIGPAAHAIPPAAGDAAQRRGPRAVPAWLGLVAAILVLGGGAAIYKRNAAAAKSVIAVVRFDNETGRPELDRLAQTLTDAAVLTLASGPRLEVIGNAAVLRTARPFRDLLVIRDTLHADYIVIGQVQRTDANVRVMTHLIRAADQTHLWVNAAPLALGGETALEAAVTERLDRAVAEYIRP